MFVLLKSTKPVTSFPPPSLALGAEKVIHNMGSDLACGMITGQVKS